MPYAGVLPVNLNDDTKSARQRELYLERHGWLPCDGRAVPIARYQELFQVIQWVYGKAPDKGDGWFLLPDYRGRFLRGVNGCAIGPDHLPRDPQVAQRQPSNTDLPAWQVGSVQEDAFQYHGHPYKHADTIKPGQAKGGAGSAPLISLASFTSGIPIHLDPKQDPPDVVMASKLNDSTCHPSQAPLDTWPEVRPAPETRVKNVYVHFIISYGYRTAVKCDAEA